MHHRQKRHHCNSSEEAEISRCMEPILSYARTLQSEVLQPTEGFKVFQTMCHLHSDFHGCVADVKCKSTQLEAVESSYGYMCGYAFDVFAQHTGCFVQVRLWRTASLSNVSHAMTLRLFASFSGGNGSRVQNVQSGYCLCTWKISRSVIGCNEPRSFLLDHAKLSGL